MVWINILVTIDIRYLTLFVLFFFIVVIIKCQITIVMRHRHTKNVNQNLNNNHHHHHLIIYFALLIIHTHTHNQLVISIGGSKFFHLSNISVLVTNCQLNFYAKCKRLAMILSHYWLSWFIICHNDSIDYTHTQTLGYLKKAKKTKKKIFLRFFNRI